MRRLIAFVRRLVNRPQSEDELLCFDGYTCELFRRDDGSEFCIHCLRGHQ